MKASYGLARLLSLIGMGATMNAPKDSRDVKGKNEGTTVPYYWGHQPIFVPSRSQRIKSKRRRLSNAKQGRN